MGFSRVDSAERIAFAYPFSASARALLEKRGTTVGFAEIERAQDFVRNLYSASFETIQSKASSAPSASDPLNYVLARMMLAAAGSDYYSRKFSRQYARMQAERLKKESPAVFQRIAKEFFPSLEQSGERASVSLPDFLKYGKELPLADVEAGRITLSREQFSLLINEAISQKFRDFSSFNASAIPQNIREAGQELADTLPSPISSTPSFGGAYLDLPCIRKILEGLGEGKRYYGSMALSVACFKDGLSKERAEEVLQQYVNACRRTSHPFTLREAFATLDWVFRHGVKGLSCRTLREQGLADKDDAFCAKCALREGRMREFAKSAPRGRKKA